MSIASGEETPDAPERPTISEFVEGELPDPPGIEIDLGQQVLVDKIKIDFLGRNDRRFIALHSFDPPRWYVHWPSVGLGFLLATLIILLWFFLKWGDSLVAAAAANPMSTSAVTLGVDGAEPTLTMDDSTVIDCLVNSVSPPTDVATVELPVPVPSTYRITVYGPPMFPTTNHVARWPLTVGDCLECATALGLDGICAVSPDTPWYDRIREDVPPILEVEGHGRYLVVDRTATFIHNTIDLWAPDPWPGGTYFCEWREVTEVDQADTNSE